MKKGDLKVKALGLAVAGVIAGSGLMVAQQAGGTQSDEKKPASSDEKAKDMPARRRTSTSARGRTRARARAAARAATRVAQARTLARARVAAPRPT
jgi:hypothetical protein